MQTSYKVSEVSVAAHALEPVVKVKNFIMQIGFISVRGITKLCICFFGLCFAPGQFDLRGVIHDDVTAGTHVQRAKSINEELQVTISGQAGVESHLSHLVCPSHEEIDHSISHNTVWKAWDAVVKAVPDV